MDDTGVVVLMTDRNLRLAVLVGADSVPTRDGLINEMITSKIMDSVDPTMREMHTLIEKDFSPLDLWAKVEPIFKQMETPGSSLAQYIKPLQELVVMRLLKQVFIIHFSGEYFDLLMFNSNIFGNDFLPTLSQLLRCRQFFIGTNYSCEPIILLFHCLELLHAF